MSLQLTDYVALAEELVLRDDEVAHRAAVSRCYWAVFSAARIAMGLKGHVVRDIHREVIERYRISPVRGEQEVGFILDLLRRFRNHADYDEDTALNKGIAQRAVLYAKHALSLLDKG